MEFVRPAAFLVTLTLSLTTASAGSVRAGATVSSPSATTLRGREPVENETKAGLEESLGVVEGIPQLLGRPLQPPPARYLRPQQPPEPGGAAGLEERPITVIPPGRAVPEIPGPIPWSVQYHESPGFRPRGMGAQRAAGVTEALGQSTEILVIEPTKIYYTQDEVGATVVASIRAAEARLQALADEGIVVAPLAADTEPAAYSLVVKRVGETVAGEERLKANHVAVIELTARMTFAQLIQEALAQWTDRPIGRILGVQRLQDGRVAIYV